MYIRVFQVQLLLYLPDTESLLRQNSREDLHFCIREKFIEHCCLLIKGSKVCSSGNISAHSPVEIIQSKCNTVFSNRSTKNRNIACPCCSCLKSRSCICKNQVNIIGNEAVNDCRTGVGISLCVLLVKGNCVFSQFFGDFILESLCRSVEASCCTS